jgi:RNA polymerase sigma-32 factor
MKPDSDTLGSAQVADIAHRLSVKPEEVVEMETRLSGRDLALEANDDDGDDAFAPIAYLADSNSEPTRVIEARAREHLHGKGLQDALGGLDERSRRIVEARWLNEEDPATLHDLAAGGVSAERIRQIKSKRCRRCAHLAPG